MSDIGHEGTDLPRKPDESTDRDWPRILLGVGMLLLLVALGVGAALKQSQGLAPKVLGLAGIAIVALAGVAYLVVFLKAKLNGNRATPAKSLF
jgi:hypothetical protein